MVIRTVAEFITALIDPADVKAVEMEIKVHLTPTFSWGKNEMVFTASPEEIEALRQWAASVNSKGQEQA